MTRKGAEQKNRNLSEEVIDVKQGEKIYREVRPFIAYNYPALMPMEEKGLEQIRSYLRAKNTMIWLTFDTWDRFLNNELMRDAGMEFLGCFQKVYEEHPFENYFLGGDFRYSQLRLED